MVLGGLIIVVLAGLRVYFRNRELKKFLARKVIFKAEDPDKFEKPADKPKD
jgi:hypothetical protein